MIIIKESLEQSTRSELQESNIHGFISSPFKFCPFLLLQSDKNIESLYTYVAPCFYSVVIYKLFINSLSLAENPNFGSKLNLYTCNSRKMTDVCSSIFYFSTLQIFLIFPIALWGM